jgi:hypothetical protein
MLQVRSTSAEEHTGYGRMSVEVARALTSIGVNVTRDPAADVLFCTVPPLCRAWLAGQRLHLLTMYETTKVPTEFRNLVDFDTIFVPCEENRRAFADWHPNVVRVPLGIDPIRWRWRPRPTSGPFTILTSGHEYRKGADLAVQAFLRAFAGVPEVRLIVKMPKPLEWFKAPADPRVQMVTGYLSAGEEVDLYASAHVYLGLSRGEGFGMMPLQAIAQGCPTVMSGCSGHTEFATYASAIVGCDLEPAIHYTLYGEAGDWWEPRVDEAVDALRDVYANYTGHQAAMWLASIEARERFTWNRTAMQIVDRIGPLGPYEGSGETRRRREALFPIQVTRHVQAEIGPHTIDYHPGTEYWNTADVKRVLHDAGYILDGTYDDPRMILPERTAR